LKPWVIGLRLGMQPNQGAEMSARVDQVSTVDYVHPGGVTAKIHFIWGATDDPVPKGLRITVKFAGKKIHILREKAVYRSFDEAKKQGIKLAAGVIDLLGEPLG
jgi:hypothetical protein